MHPALDFGDALREGAADGGIPRGKLGTLGGRNLRGDANGSHTSGGGMHGLAVAQCDGAVARLLGDDDAAAGQRCGGGLQFVQRFHIIPLCAGRAEPGVDGGHFVRPEIGQNGAAGRGAIDIVGTDIGGIW